MDSLRSENGNDRTIAPSDDIKMIQMLLERLSLDDVAVSDVAVSPGSRMQMQLERDLLQTQRQLRSPVQQKSQSKPDKKTGSPSPAGGTVVAAQQTTDPKQSSDIKSTDCVQDASAREEPAIPKSPPSVRLRPQLDGLLEDIPHRDLNDPDELWK